MTRSVIAIITVDGMGYILVAHQGRRCVPARASRSHRCALPPTSDRNDWETSEARIELDLQSSVGKVLL